MYKQAIIIDADNRRTQTSRIYRFWCWIWYGHNTAAVVHSVNYCTRCGARWTVGD